MKVVSGPGRVSLANVLGLLALGCACGCGQKHPGSVPDTGPPFVHKVPSGTPLKLALVANAPTRFWDLAQSGLNKFEQETGVKVTVLHPAHGRLEEQKQILENLVAQGYNGVMVSVVAPREQTAFIDQLARRLNVITVDSDAPDSQRLAFVEEEETLQGIEEGTIDCGVALTAFDSAYLGAGLLRDVARQGAVALPKDGVLNTGFILVDRFNVREFREARTRQSSY
jgi:ABC-type sugar transport system substrate-binding protein